ncbi:hypothetical protein A2U01_0064746, partial [Trifolium medium]|nr:hypothetical protein [Trifolium medium]
VIEKEGNFCGTPDPCLTCSAKLPTVEVCLCKLKKSRKNYVASVLGAARRAEWREAQPAWLFG